MRRGTKTAVAQEIVGAEAVREYADRVKEARLLLRRIDKGIGQHEREQKREPKNWGYVGDMGHVVEELNDVARFLKT